MSKWTSSVARCSGPGYEQFVMHGTRDALPREPLDHESAERECAGAVLGSEVKVAGFELQPQPAAGGRDAIFS
ncbi:hypothetical protein AB0C34_25775 [Nocardia sp. NPDC049220]|uniref:hypothetical protein n=1 Tax=Nocardia sp. NPDC049220 TaxID=3155273 RepID=UPI0033F01919